jgi:hypothetical protein
LYLNKKAQIAKTGWQRDNVARNATYWQTYAVYVSFIFKLFIVFYISDFFIKTAYSRKWLAYQ